MRPRAFTVGLVVLSILWITAGCRGKPSSASGQARCKKVKQGQSYDQVKAVFGRVEDQRRGSQNLHVHTWRFGKARCEVRFSGVAVSRDAQWLTGPPRKRRGPVDCAAIIQRQRSCLDALVKVGTQQAMALLKKSIESLPPDTRAKRLAVFQRTATQIGAFMRKELTAADGVAQCERETRSISPQRAEHMRACLALKSCALFAPCYWSKIAARRIAAMRP